MLKKKKKESGNGGMSQLDMLLGLVCAIFFLDTIPSVATMGWASITWIVIIGIFFFLTGSLACAELGAAYPDDGGFAGWTARAFGSKMGAFVGYLYWACNAVWLSSNSTLFVNIFQATFGLELSKLGAALLNLFIIYAMLAILLLPSKNSKGMYNYGAIVKIGIGIALIAAGVVCFVRGGTQANPFQISEFKPTLGAALVFIPALIYNFLGFETSAANGRMENPARDVPRAAIKNVVIVAALYIATSVAMLWALPVSEVSITTGIIQTLQAGFGSQGVMGGVVILVGILYLSVIFIQGMLWVGAPCNTAAVAGDTGELPKVFSKRNKHNQPVGVIIISAIMATLMTLASNLISGSAEEIFWAIFSCTSLLLIIPYIINFEAYFKLRAADTTSERPYVFPGPKWLASLLIRIAELIAIATCVLFVWTPGLPLNMTQFVFVVAGSVVVIVLGLVLIKMADKQKTAE